MVDVTTSVKNGYKTLARNYRNNKLFKESTPADEISEEWKGAGKTKLTRQTSFVFFLINIHRTLDYVYTDLIQVQGV